MVVSIQHWSGLLKNPISGYLIGHQEVLLNPPRALDFLLWIVCSSFFGATDEIIGFCFRATYLRCSLDERTEQQICSFISGLWNGMTSGIIHVYITFVSCSLLFFIFWQSIYFLNIEIILKLPKSCKEYRGSFIPFPQFPLKLNVYTTIKHLSKLRH